MKFTEADHRYTHEDEPYQGVTSLIDKYKPPKDWDAIAQKYADKGIDHVMKGFAKSFAISKKQAYELWADEFDGTSEFVRKIWNLKSKLSLDSGSFFHNYKELIDSKQDRTSYNPVSNGEKHARDLSKLENNTTYLELMCFSHLYKVCGQADKIIYTDTISCRDYKTSFTIDLEQKKFFNPITRKFEKEKFLAPIGHLTTNNYNVYALQLSLYAYMLELYGYEIGPLFIDHVIWKYTKNPNKKDLILGEEPLFNRFKVYKRTDEYPVPYLRKEAAALLLDHKNKTDFKVTW